MAINSEVAHGIRVLGAPIFQERKITAAIAVVGTMSSLPEEPGSTTAAHLRATGEALSGRAWIPSDEWSAG